MAEVSKEIISFEVDADKAAQQVTALVVKLEALQAQERELARTGQDVSRVQQQIAAVTQKLNKAITEEVTTQKALAKQTEAATRALNAMKNSQNNLEQTTQKAEKSQARFASSLARASGRVTNIGGALGLAAGGLATFTGAAELGGIALGLIANVANKAFEALNNYLFPVNEATKLSQELAGAYISEAADLSALGGIITDTTTKTDDRNRAIAALNEQYGQYLPNLLTEKSSNEEVKAAIEAVNNAIIDGIVARAKAEQASKLLNTIVQEQIRLSNLATDADLARNKTLAKLGVGLGATLLGPLGLALSQTETAGNVVSNTVEEVTKSSINANIDAAKAQLDNLNKTFDDVKANLQDVKLESLAAASTVTKESLKQQETAEKNANKLKAQQKKSNEALAGSLAALEAQLEKVNKQLNAQTKLGDTAKLQELGQTYQSLKKQIEQAKEELAAFKGEQEKINIINRNNDLGSVERLGLARDLRQSELELKQVIADIDAESTDDERQKQALQLSRLRNELFLLDVQRQQAELNKQDTAAIEKQILLAVQKRNQLEKEIPLQDALVQQQQDLTRLEIEQIRATTDPRRAQLEGQILDTKIKILETEIAIATVQGKNTLELEKQLATLQVQKAQDGTEAVKKRGEKLKETVSQILGGIEQLAGQTTEFLSGVVDRETQRIDNAISITQSRLEELTNSQQNVTAEQIQIEQERLDKLQAQREKAAEQEAIITKAQIAAQAALTIAKAAAEGGGIGSAITIATALASLVFGFAQASQVAESAFFHGTTFVQRGKNPKGKDTIPARLNEGEAVIPTDTNRKYKSAVEAIYHGTIPASDMAAFVDNYKDWKAGALGGLQLQPLVVPASGGRAERRNLRLLAQIAANTGAGSERVVVALRGTDIVKITEKRTAQRGKTQKRNS